MRRLIVVVALVALAATACKLETNYGAVINTDGTGKIIAEIGMDEEAQGFFLQEGTDPFAGQALGEIPGATTRQETRGDMTFYVIEADVDDVSQIEDMMLNDSESLFKTFSVTVTDSRVTVSATADAADTLGAQAEGFDPTVFEDSISANVKLTLPGRILTNNADRVEGNTLIWAVPVLGGTLDLQAESDPNGSPAGDGGGFPMWILVVAAAVVVAIVVYVIMQRRKVVPAVAAPDPMDDLPPPPAAE